MTPTPSPSTPPPPDKLTWALLISTFLFTFIVIGVDKLFPNESSAFQIVAGLAYGFAGAFFTRIQPLGHPPTSVTPLPPPNGTNPALPPPDNTAAAALAKAMAPATPSGKP